MCAFLFVNDQPGQPHDATRARPPLDSAAVVVVGVLLVIVVVVGFFLS